MSDQVMSPPSGAGPTGPWHPGSGPGTPGQRPDPEPEYPHRWQELFTGGVPRLGWVFRAREELVPAFAEPRPDAAAVQASVTARAAAAEKKLQRSWKWIARPSIGLALILVLLSACSATMHSSGFSPVLSVITILVLCGPGLAWTGWCWLERDKARDTPPEQALNKALAGWQERSAEHAQAALSQLAAVKEWGAITLQRGRTDIFGGTLNGWRSLITTHGASILSAGPLLIADLTGQYPARPLLNLAPAAGIPVTEWRMPADLNRSGILKGLAPAELAAAVAEALHAGAPGGARTERAADAMVLRQLAEAIVGGGITMARLAAAVIEARGRDTGALSQDEKDLITGTLFPPGGTRDQAAASLSRLESVLPGLAAKSGEGWPETIGKCVCISLDTAPRSAENEVLGALIVQWLTVQAQKAVNGFPSVIVAGAGDITSAHLERLADACELRDIPVTLLFRHLRDEAVQLLGGATTTMFMRLSNHQEAEQAVNFLGRRYTYQVSGWTATNGGSTTVTVGTGTNSSTSDSVNRGSNSGWSNTNMFGFGGTDSRGKNKGTSTSTSEGTSENHSVADGDNWSKTENVQRSYELLVEPDVIQNLAEHAGLIAARGSGSLVYRTAEFNPKIIDMAGADTDPLPPPPPVPPAASTPWPPQAPPMPPPAITTGPLPTDRTLNPPREAPPLPPTWPRSGRPSSNPSWPGPR